MGEGGPAAAMLSVLNALCIKRSKHNKKNNFQTVTTLKGRYHEILSGIPEVINPLPDLIPFLSVFLCYCPC